MFSDDLLLRARTLLDRCRSANHKIVTAESCTAGLVCGLLTEIAGSSDVVDRGFITYSNEAKREVLGVPQALLVRFGAVSSQVALAMARGALVRSRADNAIAVTGIAGPGGGSELKPVGLVYICALNSRGKSITREFRFEPADRSAVRLASVSAAMGLIEQVLD